MEEPHLVFASRGPVVAGSTYPYWKYIPLLEDLGVTHQPWAPGASVAVARMVVALGTLFVLAFDGVSLGDDACGYKDVVGGWLSWKFTLRTCSKLDLGSIQSPTSSAVRELALLAQKLWLQHWRGVLPYAR